MSYNFTKVINALDKGKSFAIFVHISPDGDAIGSGMALKRLIEFKNKIAYLCCDDKLAFSTEFLNPVIEKDDNNIDKCDTLFYIDMSAGYRSGKYEKYLSDKSKKIIVIDHHVCQEKFGDIVVRDENKSSTAEIIYDLYNAMQINISSDVATMLYTGIASDTGCFVHQNTSASSHIAVAKLIELGANITLANYELFSKRPSYYMEIVKFCTKHMIVWEDKATILPITLKQYKKLEKPESFYFVDALSHYTTDILIILTEKNKNYIKINTRSREYDVQQLCSLFNGGGHKNAAGGESKTTLKETIKKLKNILLK